MLHDRVQRELSFSNLLQRAKAVSDNRARLPDDSVKLYLGLFHAADQTHRGKDGIGHNRLVKHFHQHRRQIVKAFRGSIDTSDSSENIYIFENH